MSFIYSPSMTTTITDSTGSGTMVTLNYFDDKDGNRKIDSKKTPQGIYPSLYIKYVKSKLSKVEQKNLHQRMVKLQNLISATKSLGQRAAYEELSKILYSVVKESEAVACGYDRFVKTEDIEKFRSLVIGKTISLSKLENFPRPIPKGPAGILQDVMDKGLFDEFWILYIDYTGEKLRTNEQKIRDKDPILFGKIYGKETQFYYITDWVDEFCDLTLSKFVDTIKAKEKDYSPQVVKEIDLDLMNQIREEVKARVDRLNGTTPANFRENIVQEEIAHQKRVVKKKSWWRELLGV